MKVLTPLLFPFSVLYDVATSIRNRLYDMGIRPSAKFEVPVIGVGNLSVGGTGKTPMVEYLIRLLSGEYHIATLSRGYGRKTKGIRIASETDHALTIGDEPLQFYRKFAGKAIVAVGEERAFAIPHILQEFPETNVILLDDAFQHRAVKADFQILLTDYNNLFVYDYLLPAGRLRESKTGAARADVIVVTKCPSNITEEQMITVESSIKKYNKKAVFFTKIGYGDLLPASDEVASKPEKIILVSGIANSAPLQAYLRRNFDLMQHFSYPDHHVYTEKELQQICNAAAISGAAVLTTEKDFVKMDRDLFRSVSVSLFYLPIEVEFLKNRKEFDELVRNVLISYGK
jgi:tetraacyldisaccharide 4'-kinase